MQTIASRPAAERSFPPFSLTRLLRTVFQPKPGERICILIDLPQPAQVRDYAFLADPKLTIQRYAHDVFLHDLHHGAMDELGLQGGEMFAYQITGGSNLDLPETAFTSEGREIPLVEG